MKKLIFAVLTLAGSGTASFAQTGANVKKSAPEKMQISKKANDSKVNSNVVAMNSNAKKFTPANTSVKSVSTTNPAPAKVNAAVPLKKDGTRDKRFKSKKTKATHRVKKDGTAHKRHHANKKK